jgi:hypothetical protein
MMIRTIRRTVPRPIYMRLPPFCRLVLSLVASEKTSLLDVGSSTVQKQSLRVFDDPEGRQEHVDQGREGSREEGHDGSRAGRDHSRDGGRNYQPSQCERQAGVEQRPAEAAWCEAVEANSQPERDRAGSQGECHEEETHVPSTETRTMRLRA